MRSLNEIYHSSLVLRRWASIIRKDIIKFASAYTNIMDAAADIQDVQRMNKEKTASLPEILKLIEWATNKALYSKVE